MTHKSIEILECENYIKNSNSEIPFSSWSSICPLDISIVTTQGFEEKSVGFIEAFAEANINANSIVIGTYSNHVEENDRFRNRFMTSANCIAGKNCYIVNVNSNGNWIDDAFDRIQSTNVILDITGIGTRGLFGALDRATRSNKRVFVAYTEACEYWPRYRDWISLKDSLADLTVLPETVDNKPWLFGYEHKVELILGHEGYDSAGSERALIGFLPFKYARLAAVMSAEEYAEFIFVVGRPRLSENTWRYEALLEINRDIVKNRKFIEMSTFGYRSALEQLCNLLLENDRFLEKYNVHLALMGSKLQDVACWVLSSLIPSITVLTAVPAKCYPEAFSNGIGEKWVFPLTSPHTTKLKNSN